MNKSSQLLHESKLSSIIHTVHFYTTAWPVWDRCLSLMNILMCWAAFVCWLWYIQKIYIWSQICLRRWRDAGYRLSASSSHGCENINEAVWLIQDFKYKYCADKSLKRLSAAVWPSEILLKSVVMCLKVEGNKDWIRSMLRESFSSTTNIQEPKKNYKLYICKKWTFRKQNCKSWLVFWPEVVWCKLQWRHEYSNKSSRHQAAMCFYVHFTSWRTSVLQRFLPSWLPVCGPVGPPLQSGPCTTSDSGSAPWNTQVNYDEARNDLPK